MACTSAAVDPTPVADMPARRTFAAFVVYSVTSRSAAAELPETVSIAEVTAFSASSVTSRVCRMRKLRWPER